MKFKPMCKPGAPQSLKPPLTMQYEFIKTYIPVKKSFKSETRMNTTAGNKPKARYTRKVLILSSFQGNCTVLRYRAGI